MLRFSTRSLLGLVAAIGLATRLAQTLGGICSGSLCVLVVCVWIVAKMSCEVGLIGRALVVPGIAIAIFTASAEGSPARFTTGLFPTTFFGTFLQLCVGDFVREVVLFGIVDMIAGEWPRFAGYVATDVLTAVASYYAVFGMTYITGCLSGWSNPWGISAKPFAFALAFAPAAYTVLAVRSMSQPLFWSVYELGGGNRSLAVHLVVFAVQLTVATALLCVFHRRERVQSLSLAAASALFNAWSVIGVIYPMVDFL